MTFCHGSLVCIPSTPFPPCQSPAFSLFSSQHHSLKVDSHWRQLLETTRSQRVSSALSRLVSSLPHYILQGDTCSSISVQLGLASTYLASLNPGLDCFEPIKAGHSQCVERNATFAFTVPRCLQYGMLSAQDTCESLLLQSKDSSGNKNTGAEVVTAASWIGLYRNNPGLICPRTTPASSATNASMQVRGGRSISDNMVGFQFIRYSSHCIVIAF
ncbi:unnamed protein product [Closterium sp. NIES-53]